MPSRIPRAAGMRPRGGRRVRNAADLETAFEQAGSVLALDVVRGNARLFIVIR